MKENFKKITSLEELDNLKSHKGFSIEYENLKELFPKSNPPYSYLLLTIEWLEFRKKVLERDNYKCQKCHNHYTDVAANNNFIAFVKKRVYGRDIVSGSFKLQDNDYIEVEELIRQDKFHYLQAHHEFYLYGLLPWEYDISSLVSLCQYCHANIHNII